MIYADVDRVLDKHRDRLLTIDGIVDVEAHLEEDGFILVYIDGKIDELRGAVPHQLDGYKVRVVHVRERKPYYRIL